ncbi:sensor histidine kinase [Serinicoccus marinus]|uniref:sensor histidine kinase n=1 Tax=Serinicoccus marinus TaxID=247333 RepID=UPI0003B2FDE1|nr:histidine kinase [Serinicoccus marinus]
MTRHPVRTVDALVAAGSWGLSVTVLLCLPLLAAGEPASADSLPAVAGAAWWAGLALVSVQALVLLRRRRAPRSVLVLVAAGAPAAALAGMDAGTGVTSVAVIVAAFAAVLLMGVVRALPAAAAAAFLVGSAQAFVSWSEAGAVLAVLGSSVVQGVGTVGLPLATAVFVRARRDVVTARAEQAQAVVREHDALVQVAVARERTATARELHDIAAHHLSGITVMTGALGRQIDTDPEGAKRAVEQVRHQSKAMLRDLRSLVTLLREDGGPTGATAPETLSSLPALVEGARRAGTDVELTVLGPGPGDVLDGRSGPLAQFGAYRTVQEALANAARHAPGARCEVVLDTRDARTTRVRVVNHPAPADAPTSPGTGYGLVGMRERASLTGAHLSYGPTEDGGWCVDLSLPGAQAGTDHPDPGHGG